MIRSTIRQKRNKQCTCVKFRPAILVEPNGTQDPSKNWQAVEGIAKGLLVEEEVDKRYEQLWSETSHPDSHAWL